MDEFSSKRAAGGLGSRRGHISFQDNHESKSIQCCNRQGCSTKHYSSRETQIRSPDKLKLTKPAFLSTSSRTTFGSSCRAPSTLNVHGKSRQERRNTLSMQERVTAESSCKQEKKEHFESSTRQEEMIKLHVDPASADMQTIPPENVDPESSILQGFTMNRTDASRDCQRTSSSKIQKPKSSKTESSNQAVASSSFVRHSVLTRNATHIGKPSQNQGTNVQRQGLRNLTCTSISDVLPSGCSSNVHQNRRTVVMRKRHTDGENSAGRGKKPIGSSIRGNTDFSRSGPCGSSRVERPLAEPTSRRTRNQPTGRVRALSVRTQRPASGDSRVRFLENGDDSTLLLPEPLMIPSTSRVHNSLDEADTASLSQSFPTYFAPICLSSSGRHGSSSGTTHSRTMAHFEDSNSRELHDLWVDRDSYQHLNMEGIEEVLSLGRIEQDEEQLMALQSNLFMGGIGFHDQHSDWRLDIDNMSYEELLALEEKMGTVSTALSEEEMSKCLRKRIYTPVTELGVACRNNDDHDDGDEDDDDDDVKCSICQEEYITCDEIGKLHCDHCYHMACIQQWLRQKNWCPICKSSACPS